MKYVDIDVTMPMFGNACLSTGIGHFYTGSLGLAVFGGCTILIWVLMPLLIKVTHKGLK